MKRANFIISAAVLFLAANSACQLSSSATLNNSPINAGNESNVNKTTPKTENKNVSQNAPVKTASSFVIIGAVYLKENKVVIEDDFLGHDENAEETKLYPENKVEIDLLNCAGYLASAVTSYKVKDGVRKIKLISETVAPNAAEKIKQCAAAPGDKIVQSKVFGIAAREGKRRNVEIKKTDAKKAYDSLVKSIADIKMIKTSDKAAIPRIKATKAALSLESDNWTDADGDGTIDLIEFHDEPCENENDSCTWIFRLVDGRWENIDYVFPM